MNVNSKKSNPNNANKKPLRLFSSSKKPRSTKSSRAYETFNENSHAFKQYVGIRSIFNPLWCLYGLRISVAMLSVFGLFMVFSSSSVTMITYGAGPWGSGISQLIYCIIGFIGYLIFSRLPVDFYKSKIIV
ncbi:cell division protein FtsW, partial [Gardnerella vaginalis]